MRIRFVGSGDNDPAGVSFGGVYFPKGESVEVSAELAARLKGHSHYETVKGRPRNDQKPHGSGHVGDATPGGE